MCFIRSGEVKMRLPGKGNPVTDAANNADPISGPQLLVNLLGPFIRRWKLADEGDGTGIEQCQILWEITHSQNTEECGRLCLRVTFRRSIQDEFIDLRIKDRRIDGECRRLCLSIEDHGTSRGFLAHQCGTRQ